MTQLSAHPHRLAANKVPVYYAGGAGIDRFRGTGATAGPEDWVGSVNALPAALLADDADQSAGVSRLPDGSSLRDAVATDPIGWLGDRLSRAYGGEPGLLVKLLDAGERLPVHAHPTRELAQAKLGSPFGKTEGWIIMASEPGAEIWLGFRRAVTAGELMQWIDERDVDAMLGAMNRLPVSEGDVFYLPAGLPHSIGPGVMLTELQEPTSFSILAEYARFGLTESQATLGLGWEVAVACFDLRSYDAADLGDLRPTPRVVGEQGESSLLALFPEGAEPFFQALRAEVRGSLTVAEPSFRVVVVNEGVGTLSWETGSAPIARGQTWVIPFAAGSLEIDGVVDMILCIPPAVLT
jgi:mannose-6-phosphate isomerase